MNKNILANQINSVAQYCNSLAVSAGWWNDLSTGKSLVGTRNRPEMLMLMVSELSEAMEGLRKNKMDDHLPHRKMEEVELADCIIRIFDYAVAHNYDIGTAIVEKLKYNQQRPDHKIENRKLEGGKKF